MSLKLHYHPLSSFCWKTLIALYEIGAPFEPHLLDLGDPAVRAALEKLWPMSKMPVLQDRARGVVVPEAGAIVEYLQLYYPGPAPLIPADSELAWNTRLMERILDLHIHLQMVRIVGDRLRPEGGHDPLGVDQARAQLRTAYGVVEDRLGDGPWMIGETFTLADCAAAPALFYADKVEPLGDAHPGLSAYLERVKQRPSFARVLEEAEPYFGMFPG